MKNIVAITSQGQLTIPKEIRLAFGILGATKATVIKEGDQIIVRPNKKFSDLAGALSSNLPVTDTALRQARVKFGKQWPRKA